MKPVCVFSQENKESLSKKMKTDFISAALQLLLSTLLLTSADWGSKWPPHYRRLTVILTWVSVRSPLASEQLTDTWRIFQMALSSDHSSACVNDQSVGLRWAAAGQVVQQRGGWRRLGSAALFSCDRRLNSLRRSEVEVYFRFDIGLTVSAALTIIDPLID